MTPRAYRSVAWVLALSALLMLGATTGGVFAHEIEHASHHTAGMHSSGICAWMCATAGAVITAPIQQPSSQIVQDAPPLPAVVGVSADPFSTLLPRAPPALP